MADVRFRRLHETIAAVCPIDGVSGSEGAVQIHFSPSSTAPQREAGASALAAFDWSPAAQTAWEDGRVQEYADLKQDAATAISGNQDFLAIGTPSNAQVLAQVRALTRQNNRIIARLLQIR